MNKTNFDIQEKLSLTINLEDINDAYDLRITTLGIKIPEKLLLVKTPKGMAANNNIISWSGTLAPKEKKSFAVELQSQVTGNYSIPIEASYKISKFSETAENIASIGVYCNCPYLSHDFSQQIAVPEQRVGLKAFVINPSKIHDFRNVKVNYITDIPNIRNFSIAYASIKPFETIKIFDSSVITPPLNEIYYFNITVVYESAANQVFVVKDNVIIKVPGWEEKTPEKEEKTEVEEQQETEEQQAEEVALGAEKSEEETDEEKQEEPGGEEIPVTTIEDKEETPIKAFIVIACIAALIFILVVIILFKRKKAEGKEKPKGIKELGTAIEKRQIIKESLSNIFRGIKEKIKRKSSIDKQEESEYKQLEKEIQNLGRTLEKKK